MSKAKIGAAVISVLLLLYLIFMVQRGMIMLREPNIVAKLLADALLVLPIIGAWALIVELLFGARIERLGKQLAEEGGLPPDDLPRTPGGRILREAADEQFELYAREAEEAPDDWRSWFRLSIAYDAAGDRRRARSTMRKAITMERTARRESS